MKEKLNIRQKINRKNYFNKIILISFLCFIFFNLNSQDLHFSQYSNAPLLTNPANTGFSPESDFRIGFNHRTQWASTNVPYKTLSAWGDVQLMRDKLDNGWLGLGLVMLNDVAGSGNLTSTKSYLSLAYHQLLDDNNLLSIGLSGGWVQKRIDFTKLTFDQQWNGKFFDIDLPTNEPFVSNSVSYIDLNVGINYSWFANDNFYLNMGLSMMHLNTPQESFFNSKTVDARLNRRYNAFAKASIKISDVLILSPHIYYSSMSTSEEAVIGFNGQYNLGGTGGQNQLLFGIQYRNKDAATPSLGFQIDDIQLMFNYDATISTLNAFSNYRNAYEMSFLWNGIFGGISKNERSVKCHAPRF